MRITDEALEIVRQRAKVYGDPRFNLDRTAEFWSTYLGIPLTRRNVVQMHILEKISRDQHKDTRENSKDTVGYCIAQDWADNPADYEDMWDKPQPDDVFGTLVDEDIFQKKGDA